MKNMIITAAAVFLITFAMNGWWQLHDFVRSGERLRDAAEDAAAAAALCTDAEAFSAGFLRFDREASLHAAESILKENLQKAWDETEWSLTFSEEEHCPAVRITLSCRGVKAEAVYAYAPLRYGVYP